MPISSTYDAPWRVAKVKAMPHYILEIEFNDSMQGFVEMADFIQSNKAGVFSKLKDITLFNQVYIEYGAVTWPGEIDLAPDTMHDKIRQMGRWHVE